MKELQKMTKGREDTDMVITSRMVAEKFNKLHRTVLHNIYNLYATDSVDIQKFVTNNFKLSLYRDDKQREYPEFWMTLQGFYFVGMSLGKRSPLLWRIKFIEAFNIMEEAIRSRQSTEGTNPDWLEANIIPESKIIRKDFTGVIKKFIEYAKKQGSQNADRYYIHYTKMNYGILDMLLEETRTVFPNFRDNLEIQGLSSIVLAENAAAHWLEKGMEAGMEYHDIFYFVKEKVSETLGIISLPSKTRSSSIQKISSKIKKEAETRTRKNKKAVDKKG